MSAPEQPILEALSRIEETLKMQARLAFNQIEAAKVLGMDPRTLREETKLGRVKRTPRGLYPRAELERYLSEQTNHNEFMEAKGVKANGSIPGAERFKGVLRLTKAEYDVFMAMAEGMSSRQIANRPGRAVSIKTVESHQQHARAELGLANQGELRMFAVQYREWLRDNKIERVERRPAEVAPYDFQKA